MNGFKILLFILFVSVLNTCFSQKSRKIEILRANSLEFDKRRGKDIKRLIGNVKLKQEQVYIYCDSAYFYSKDNMVDAFSNVHIIEKGKINAYGDFLKYRGNEKKAVIYENVRLIDDSTTLTTDIFEYNTDDEIGHYYDGGKIVDDSTVLISKTGYYYAKTKDYFFNDSVVLTHPDYTIFSDTMKYNSGTEIVTFLGPTDIYSDSSYIYCEYGWYNTKNDIAKFSKNAYLEKKENTLKADSIFYNKKKGIGKAFMNVELTDTVQNIIINGDFATYYDEPEYFMITKNAVFTHVTDTDSLYLHADTLMSEYDTSGSHKQLIAYNKVKFYKFDLQGKCDSLIYSLRDSVIRLFYAPVLWSEENQLTSDYMELHTKNNIISHIIMDNSAFIIEQEDTLRFNQIKGKNMIGFFDEGELYKIDILSNGQSLYFPKDDDKLIGVNKAECSNMTIYRTNKEIDKIHFYTKPKAILHPIGELPHNELKLDGFVWLDGIRPKEKKDIFIWYE